LTVIEVMGMACTWYAELVGVGDDIGSAREVVDVRPERGRVHGHQHIRGVARREDVMVSEMKLEAGDAGESPCGGANLGGEVRQRRKVVAESRRFLSESVAGELHTVA
jgi:hypothetical protein